MNKKLIAMAIAGALAAPLAANAEVTVTGQLQQEIVSWDGDSAILDGIQVDDGGEFGTTGNGNASEVAVAIAEDLGGGLKAIGKAGFNLSVDENTGLTGRDAYVGLSGGFGTVLVGQISTPYKASTVKWDPFLATFAQARGNGGMSGGIGSGTGHNGYASNVIAYANNFGSVKFVAGISVDEVVDPSDPTSTRGDHIPTLSVNVPVGPVELAVAYLDVAALDNGAMAKVGAKYSAGPLTVAAQYEALDEQVGDGTMIYLTASYTAGANTFSASVGNYSADNTIGGDPEFTDDTDYAAIGVKHAFSKSTSAHVAYRTTDAGVAGDESAIGVGLRVKF